MLARGHKYPDEVWIKKIIPMWKEGMKLSDILTRFPMNCSSFYKKLQKFGVKNREKSNGRICR